ncbi:hypothetical protein DAEQUDRAFT_766343 [Daedalea quercina L-15889]|uniref:Uncharacterized protein n=1 Tax=Daedalea quercina L-15889 TaxID=1314783 RepID=A0A165PL42_9APHY|nr:hypothetical protein DAEQUDRAFT_766343 [Daedalea quercina L-15889]
MFTLIVVILRVARRFREVGYENEDIKVIRLNADVNIERNLTARVWRRIKLPLELPIRVALYKRLEREAADVIIARKALVKKTYDGYRRTLSPMDSVRLPPPELVYVMPAFRSLIYSNLDAPLDQATCDNVGRQLPEHLLSVTISSIA